MKSFTIQNISATPDFSTRRSDGSVSNAGEDQMVWDDTSELEDTSSPLAGSKRPVTFKIPEIPLKRYKANICLRGTCTLPREFAGAEFTVGNEFLRSATVKVPDQIPESGVQIDLHINGFNLVREDLKAAGLIPFQKLGELRWSLSFEGFPSIRSRESPLLEFYWVASAAPHGPLIVPNRQEKTDMDLGGVWPVQLLRFFVPPWEQISSTKTDSNVRDWWATHVMNRIWSWGNSETERSGDDDSIFSDTSHPDQSPGTESWVVLSHPWRKSKPRYDTLGGRPFYVTNSMGGSFDLEAWVNSSYQYLNCYDLAAITQLGCTILRDPSDGTELLDSRWVFQSPTGYILPSYLYGWTEKGLCNNPFFSMTGSKPLVPVGTARGRVQFSNHAWIEVTVDDGRTNRPLDATCIVRNEQGVYFPEDGTRSRDQYHKAHIDVAASKAPNPATPIGNMKNFVSWADPVSHGNCCKCSGKTFVSLSPLIASDTNNDFSYQITSKPPPPNINREGVRAVGKLPVINSRLIDPVMKSSVDAAIRLTRNRNLEGNCLSNASLTPELLAELVSAVVGDCTLVSCSTSLAAEASLRTMEFAISQDDDNTGGRLELCVHVSKSHEEAFNRFKLLLCRYHCDLSSIISQLDIPIGEFALKDPRSVFFVRRNILVELFLPNKSHRSRASEMLLQSVANKLDDYLSEREVDHGSHSQPSIALVQSSPLRALLGTRFTLRMAEPDVFTPATTATSNRGLVVPQGNITPDGDLEFYAASEGEEEVTILTAHKDTLFPASHRVAIRVERPEIG